MIVIIKIIKLPIIYRNKFLVTIVMQYLHLNLAIVLVIDKIIKINLE